MKISRLVPWVSAVVLHVGVLALPFGLFFAPQPAAPIMTVDLSLTGPAGGVRRSVPAPPAQSSAPSGPAVTEQAPARVPEQQGTAFSSAPLVSPTVAPQDAAPVSSTDPLDPAYRAAAPEAAQAAAPGAPEIGWQGSVRTLLESPAMQFPQELQAAGQEVDGEWQIKVAPNGAVLDVETTQGTGYIEIDERVKAALRKYLFSRVDGRGNDIGTVRFRFRLEKTD